MVDVDVVVFCFDFQEAKNRRASFYLLIMREDAICDDMSPAIINRGSKS